MAAHPEKNQSNNEGERMKWKHTKTFPLSEDEIGRSELKFLLLEMCKNLGVDVSEKDKNLMFGAWTWFLAEYPIEAISDAFHEFITTKKDVPIPADIYALLTHQAA